MQNLTSHFPVTVSGCSRNPEGPLGGDKFPDNSSRFAQPLKPPDWQEVSIQRGIGMGGKQQCEDLASALTGYVICRTCFKKVRGFLFKYV